MSDTRNEGRAPRAEREGVDRREFIRRAGTGVLGAAVLNDETLGPWPSALGPRSSALSPVGIQLYTLRAEMAKDFEGTIAAVGAIGYREVEFAGYFDRSPKAVQSALERAKLAAPSAHIGASDALSKDWERTLDTAKAIGHEWVVCAWLDASVRKTLDDYRRLSDLFNNAAAAAKAKGLRFAYHNHDFEFERIGGKIPYDTLLERTDPALVKFEMDLYWINKGRQDPFAYFARWPGRFPMVHVKDMDATPARGIVDVGKGIIDFKAIFAKRAQAGIEHYFVENDEPKPNGIESAKVSYAYLSKLTI